MFTFPSALRAAILAAVLFVAFSAKSLAQSSATVTLNVTLTNILQLTVTSGLGTASLNFSTVNDYQAGVTATVNNQLSILSNRAYDLKVKASSADLIDGSNTIPVSKIAVSVANAGALGGSAATVSALSTTDQALLTGASAAILQAINLTYSAPGNDNAFAKPAGTYTTTLTYTATAN